MAALLLVTAVLSGLPGEAIDATIILVILAGSGFLGFVQEWRADSVVEELLALIRTRTRRAGIESEIAIEDVVPGDVLCPAAGDMVPASSA